MKDNFNIPITLPIRTPKFDISSYLRVVSSSAESASSAPMRLKS